MDELLMKLVYVIGSYRAECEYQVARNIANAEIIAKEVWKMGAACLCPHKNTALFGGLVDDANFLAGDLKMLSYCDAAICVEGWQKSSGSRDEVKYADSHKIPVFQSLEMLREWVNHKW